MAHQDCDVLPPDPPVRLARSANALWSALDFDPTAAAADAAYEAHAVLDGWEPLIDLWR